MPRSTSGCQTCACPPHPPTATIRFVENPTPCASQPGLSVSCQVPLIGFAFGSRFFVLLGVGLLALGPALFEPRLASVVGVWDAVVLTVWLVDLYRLPAADRFIVRRTWAAPAALGVPSRVQLTIFNTSGITFQVSPTVTGTLTLNGGNLTAASGQFIAINSTGSVSLLTSNYILGKLVMYSPAATPTTFPVGTSSGYAPVDVTPSSSGDITITANPGAYSNDTGTNAIARYWTILPASASSVSLTFHYNAADITGTEANYVAGRFSSTWTRPSTTIDTVNHTATVSGVTAYNGDWTVGEASSVGSVCTSAPSNIVSWYRAEGNANDGIGANNGTLAGGATAAATGEVGTAFSFNGSTAYVTAPDDASLHLSSFSIEGWFNFTSTPTTDQVLVAKTAGTGTNESFVVWANGSALNGAVGDANGISQLSASFSPSSNTWYHLAFTFDGSTHAAVLYVNGSSVASSTLTKVPAYDTHPFQIGAEYENETLTDFMNGLADEVTLYSSVLTSTNIQSIYNAGSTGKCYTAPSAPTFSTISPASGSIAGGTSVVINGANIGKFYRLKGC